MAITLHYSPTDASLAPHLFLAELGVPFRLALVDRSIEAQKSADYLRMNPNGLIPVLVDGDCVIYETAAILLHLADRHGQGDLAPPALGSAARSQLYKWLFWTSSTLHAALIPYFYPERWVAPGNAVAAAEVKKRAQMRVEELLQQVESQLATGGPWLLGAGFSILDPYVLMLGGWTRHFARPAAGYAHLGPYLRRVADRPAARAVLSKEGIDGAIWFGH